MAAGCPVIASNAAAIPEVCGDAATDFDPRDDGALAAAVVGCSAGKRNARRWSAADASGFAVMDGIRRPRPSMAFSSGE
jgi:hypothetical protein